MEEASVNAGKNTGNVSRGPVGGAKNPGTYRGHPRKNALTTTKYKCVTVKCKKVEEERRERER